MAAGMRCTKAIVYLLVCTLIVTLLPALMLGCAIGGGKAPAPSAKPSFVVWYDAQKEKKAWPAWDELAVFTVEDSNAYTCQRNSAALIVPQAAVIDNFPNGLVLKIPPSARSSNGEMDRRIEKLKVLACVSAVGLVYYTGKQRDPATRLIHTDELIVRFRPSLEPVQIADLESEFGLMLKQNLRYAPNTMIYSVDNPRLVIEKANRLRSADGVIYAYPNWLRQRVAKR